MKPFDIEKAKAGHPVCTRDGRKVRIICFDAKREDKKSIIALVPSKDSPGFENLIAYPNNGNYYRGHENDGDLMMASKKKTGWINIYPCPHKEKAAGLGLYVHKTQKEAEDIADSDCIATIQINWEE